MIPIVAELVVREDGSQELYFSHECADGSYGRDPLPLDRRFGWTVVQAAPLTVTPFVYCTECGTQGWIREGVWVSA